MRSISVIKKPCSAGLSSYGVHRYSSLCNRLRRMAGDFVTALLLASPRCVHHRLPLRRFTVVSAAISTRPVPAIQAGRLRGEMFAKPRVAARFDLSITRASLALVPSGRDGIARCSRANQRRLSLKHISPELCSRLPPTGRPLSLCEHRTLEYQHYQPWEAGQAIALTRFAVECLWRTGFVCGNEWKSRSKRGKLQRKVFSFAFSRQPDFPWCVPTGSRR